MKHSLLFLFLSTSISTQTNGADAADSEKKPKALSEVLAEQVIKLNSMAKGANAQYYANRAQTILNTWGGRDRDLIERIHNSDGRYETDLDTDLAKVVARLEGKDTIDEKGD